MRSGAGGRGCSYMAQFWAVLWIPYLLLLLSLYARRSVLAPILLLCSGALWYRLPLFAGLDGRLFHIGVLCCIGLSVLEGIQAPPRRWKADPFLYKAVFFYFLFVLFSVGVGEYDRLPTKIYAAIDFCLLFFICNRCVSGMRDARRLLAGVLLAVGLMGGLGIIE